jgi:queuine/archaeosine tRNA-ribosyltransferase
MDWMNFKRSYLTNQGTFQIMSLWLWSFPGAGGHCNCRSLRTVRVRVVRVVYLFSSQIRVSHLALHSTVEFELI